MKGITRELLTLELDGLPPTVNHMYMNAKGRRFRTSECREYQQRVTAALQSAWRSPPFPTADAGIWTTVSKRYRTACKWQVSLRTTHKLISFL